MSSDENSSKRTRASGEVLDYLLQEFEKSHNPIPEQRKEISERTGMSEKAVRIWFQNRRAKLRKVERMSSSSSIPLSTNKKNPTISTNIGSHHSSRSNSLSLNEHNISPQNPTSATSINSNNYLLSKNDKHIPIEVNEKYCFIDCSSLSVGSWQRIKSGYHDEQALRNKFVNLSPFTLNTVMNSVDLLLILSKKNSEINYFFSAVLNNSKILFRIFYPISSVITCSLLDNNINKESNELRVSLSHQPKFSVYFFNGINSNSNQWSICDDFSEGQQVSQAYFNEGGTSIPHVLVGVKNSLRYLNSYILEHQLQNQQQNHHIHQQQLQQQLNLANPNFSNTSATDFHANHINLIDDNHSSGNLQFTADDLNNIWDDANSLTSNTTHNHIPVDQSYTTGSVSAHPPAGQKSTSVGLGGFSPLTNFDSANSPTSSASYNNSNFPERERATEVNGEFDFHSNPVSRTNTPKSAASGGKTEFSNIHPTVDEREELHNGSTYDDMFNNGNTPDFINSVGGEGDHHNDNFHPSYNNNEELSLHDSQKNSIPSDVNSPSTNLANKNDTTNNSSNNNVHAYTHQTNGHYSYDIPGMDFNDSHHHLDFDLSTEFTGTGSKTNQTTPLTELNNNSGNGDQAGQNNSSSGNTDSTANGNTNADSFIDFGL